MKKYVIHLILAIFVAISLSACTGRILVSAKDIGKPNALNHGKVSVKNFLFNLPQDQILSKEYDAIIVKEKDYQIIFYSNQKCPEVDEYCQSFIVSLLGGNLENTRKQAEQGLLDVLDVGRHEACRLFVAVTVPIDTDYDISGTDYHLSFCPDGIPFPSKLAP
ncbi:MAG: hypothetical protein WCT49_00125 [Candidatus Paceibacterota bacterium]|jgi:hypothetical protein|nr:hypothetical protein [Candidatus Paceibacterota bacterium]